MLPRITKTFDIQGTLTQGAAYELGLKKGTPISYRAGDQPNNAFSLNVLNPGEIAATAGTSGVVYGVSDQVKFDLKSRVNTFVHVNNSENRSSNGILLCVNGTGILNSWIKKIAGENLSYAEMNKLAAQIKPASDGLLVFPFGNGAERMLENKEIGCSFHNLNFNIHTKAHIFRAIQEGIAFAFCYGIKIMQNMGVSINVIKAGKANMFLSSVFCETLANITGATIELYNTDGAQGAARGAGIGAGIYKSFDDAFIGLIKMESIKPAINCQEIKNNYIIWENLLLKKIN